MSDDLYERDVLAWSRHQADLLRRLGRGERVNDVDWARVAEEIEDVGLSELHSVEDFLNRVMVHALPESDSADHRRGEIAAFRNNARRRFAPSMRQRVNVGALYAEAVEQLNEAYPGLQLPSENPFALDQLLNEDTNTLLGSLAPAA